MKRRSLPLLNYLLGVSLVLLVASTCFSTRSSSTAPPSTPSRNGFEAAATASTSRADMASRESVLAFPASPFAPIITATKSHAPAGSASPGDTLTYTVVITNSGTSDATGVSFSDTIDPNTTLVGGSVKASPIATADSYHTIGNVNISVPVAQGVLANDANPNGSGTLTVTKVNATAVPGGGSATASTTNGSVTMSSDGSFTYTPNAAFRGPSDSFTYTLDNGTGFTDTATVTIAVNGLIWFVDSNAATNGDGRLNSPFNCLVGAGCYSSAASIANDNIFVYSGSYTGGLTLANGQKLIGQGAGDTLLNITSLVAPSGTNLLPATGGTKPTISAAGADLTLASGNTVRGVTLNGTAGASVALSGSGFGTVVVGETSLGGTGQALNLSTGTLSGPVASTASFTSISSSNSAATGISLSSVSGAMSSGSTTVTNPTGVGISVNTSSAALNFGNTSSTSSGGTGVSLTSNTGTIAFGALTITPDANQRGLLATDNTQTITTAGGAISTTGAIAVEITRAVGTTPLAVSLASVSASGDGNGIKLTNTSGSFTITGDGGGSNNGSGGTITGTTAEGVVINNASNVSLGYMNITNPGTNGIRGTGVNGFTLNRSNISDNAGNNTADDGVGLSNTSGALAITNSSITSARHQGITVDNLNTNLSSLTLQATSVTGTPGGDGVLIQMRGTSVLTTGTIGGATAALGNTLSNNSATGLQVNNADTANIQSLTVQNNTVSGNNAGMDFDLSQGASMTIRVLNNTLTNQHSQALNIFTGSTHTGSMTATVQGNTIGTAGVNDSGSAIGSGVRVFLQNATAGAITIDGNQIREVPNGSGIDVEASGHTASNTVKLKISNNTLPRPTGTNQNVCGTGNFPCPLSTIFVLSDTDGPVETVCASITGNSAYDPNSWPDGAGWSAYYLAARSSAVLRIEGNTSQTPRQVILNNNTVTNLTAPGFGDFTDESGNVVVVSPGTCGTFPMSVAPEFAISSKGVSDAQPEDALLVGGIEKPGQKPISALTQQELNWMVQAALLRWQQAGISAEDLARLNQVSFEVTQLGNGQLASRNGLSVRVDEKAAGYGWYFDPQPTDDSEYDVAVTGKERQASETSAAFGRMDLLTVVMRNLGSVYLQNQKRVPKALRVLMESTLAPSVRRLPVFNAGERSTSSITSGANPAVPGAVQATSSSPRRLTQGLTALRSAGLNLDGELAAYAKRARRVAAFSPVPYSGETVTLNVGTLPAGKSVTITFQVTIDNPLPAGVCSVTNTGHITGSNISPVDTNSDVTNINKPLTLSACPGDVTKNTDAGVCTAVVTYTAPTADGCPAPTVTCTPASGTAFNKGVTTVTCTASNGVSPDASCTFTVTVNDNEAPQITCPANITHSTDANVCTAVVAYATPTATDNCPGIGAVTCTPASGTTFNKGTTTVTCSVSDASSNNASCSFTVTVNDTQAPTITCPANVVHGTDTDACTAAVTYATPTVSDNCPGVGAPSCSPVSGSTFPKGVTTVTCSVTDASGNPATCSFTVTVNDTQAPTIGACPSNISVVSGGACQTVTYTPPTATDNCGSATVTCAPPSGFCFPNGTTTVTCTASDTSPDSPDSSCSFTVTVVPCTITCPANITAGTNPSQQCGTVVNYPAPSTSGGGCGTVTCSPSSGSFFPVGTTMVTCSTQAGPSCGFTVTVIDNTPPVLNCAPDQTVLAGTGCQAQVPNFVVSASDNCGGVTVTQTPAPGTIVGPGTYAIHVSATDGAGNTSTCDKTFTVTNNPPVVVNVTGPSGPIALGTSASVTASYTDTAMQGHTATFSWGDGSPNTTVAISPASSGNVTASHTYAATGVYTVTVTVTDDCGAASAAFAYQFIVVYDANGGFVTGGGWIQSAAGSYAANPSLTGKANFGFVAKYQNGASVPTGNTEFKFDSMNFKATAYEWLVISGAKAQFKGSGTINGAGDYRFLVTVTDGNQPGGGGTDKFRIKIWDASTNAVIYDNVMGAPDDINLANPQALGGGSIVIH